MTVLELATVAVAGTVGFAVAAGLVRLRLNDPPDALMRVNVRGVRVPAVLGVPMALAALVALGLVALASLAAWEPAETGAAGGAVAVVIAVMTAAGAIDDRRGDEASRGFKGHLGAMRSGRLTGGILKIVAGGVAGLAAGVILFRGDVEAVIGTALLVALSANAINLFDRAPGRAAKVFLVMALPLLVIGDVSWAVATAGLVGALVACLSFDLGEAAMLGDAGANPLGGAVGVGLAASLDAPGRWTAVVVLLALNLASERWSFSRAIASTPWLDRVDRIGRK